VWRAATLDEVLEGGLPLFMCLPNEKVIELGLHDEYFFMEDKAWIFFGNMETVRLDRGVP
jgi:hypothetical protein